MFIFYLNFALLFFLALNTIAFYLYCTRKKDNKDELSINEHLISYCYGLRDIKGRYVFVYKDLEKTKEDNINLIFKLFNLSLLPKRSVEKYLRPLVDSFANLVSTLPASERHHDCAQYGLLRHSLLVAIEAVTLCNQKYLRDLTYDRESLILLSIALSFNHDLNKMLTDYKVMDSHGNVYNFLKDKSLSHFMQKSDNNFLFLDFIEERGDTHNDEDLKIQSLYTLYSLNNALYTDLLCNFDFKSKIYKDIVNLVKEADGLCVFNSKAYGHKAISIPLYLKALILSYINLNMHKINKLDSDIFLTTTGILVKFNSFFYHKIIRALQELKSGSNLDNPDFLLKSSKLLLCKYNLVVTEGSYSITSWYKVEKSNNSIFVHALLLQFEKIKDELCLNAIALGKKPQIIEDLKERFVDSDNINSFILDNSFFKTYNSINFDFIDEIKAIYAYSDEVKDELLKEKHKKRLSLKRDASKFMRSHVKDSISKEDYLITDTVLDCDNNVNALDYTEYKTYLDSVTEESLDSIFAKDDKKKKDKLLDSIDKENDKVKAFFKHEIFAQKSPYLNFNTLSNISFKDLDNVFLIPRKDIEAIFYVSPLNQSYTFNYKNLENISAYCTDLKYDYVLQDDFKLDLTLFKVVKKRVTRKKASTTKKKTSSSTKKTTTKSKSKTCKKD